MSFDHILNWKLLSGSHEFPGPDGGTCVNEAAVVAAGFEYREIRSADDCPECFSRPIAAFAIKLNDTMPDKLRQELLLPFVFRLAGSRDTPEIEKDRLEYMVLGICREVISILLRGWKEDLAEQFSSVKTLKDANLGALDLAHDLAHAHTRARARALAHALAHTRAYARDLALARAHALDLARALALDLDLARAHALDLAHDLDLDLAPIYIAAVRVLDGALRIGKQAESLDLDCVRGRMAKVKAKVKSQAKEPVL